MYLHKTTQFGFSLWAKPEDIRKINFILSSYVKPTQNKVYPLMICLGIQIFCSQTTLSTIEMVKKYIRVKIITHTMQLYGYLYWRQSLYFISARSVTMSYQRGWYMRALEIKRGPLRVGNEPTTRLSYNSLICLIFEGNDYCADNKLFVFNNLICFLICMLTHLFLRHHKGMWLCKHINIYMSTD